MQTKTSYRAQYDLSLTSKALLLYRFWLKKQVWEHDIINHEKVAIAQLENLCGGDFDLTYELISCTVAPIGNMFQKHTAQEILDATDLLPRFIPNLVRNFVLLVCLFPVPNKALQTRQRLPKNRWWSISISFTALPSDHKLHKSWHIHFLAGPRTKLPLSCAKTHVISQKYGKCFWQSAEDG